MAMGPNCQPFTLPLTASDTMAPRAAHLAALLAGLLALHAPLAAHAVTYESVWHLAQSTPSLSLATNLISNFPGGSLGHAAAWAALMQPASCIT